MPKTWAEGGSRAAFWVLHRSLVVGLEALADQIGAAVPSWSSVSISLRHREARTEFVIVDPGQERVTALASLTVSLLGASGGDELTLRAGEAGAFLLLADDLAGGLGPDVVKIALDRHLDAPPRAPALAAANADLSDVEQAVGALLDRGLLPEPARAELARRAQHGGISIAAAARTLLASLQGPVPGRGPPQAPDRG